MHAESHRSSVGKRFHARQPWRRVSLAGLLHAWGHRSNVRPSSFGGPRVPVPVGQSLVVAAVASFVGHTLPRAAARGEGD